VVRPDQPVDQHPREPDPQVRCDRYRVLRGEFHQRIYHAERHRPIPAAAQFRKREIEQSAGLRGITLVQRHGRAQAEFHGQRRRRQGGLLFGPRCCLHNRRFGSGGRAHCRQSDHQQTGDSHDCVLCRSISELIGFF
jgi:hypothetical protein